jgi:hypothetical protein
MAILLCERSIGEQALHLLLAVREDRLELRHLVAAQTKSLAEMRGLFGWVDVAVMSALMRLRGLRRIRSGRLVAVRRLCEQDSRRKQRAQNDSCLCHVHTLVLPPGLDRSSGPVNM